MPDNLVSLNNVPVLRAIPLISGIFTNIVSDIVPAGTYLKGMFSDPATLETVQWIHKKRFSLNHVATCWDSAPNSLMMPASCCVCLHWKPFKTH